ncbi:hypothetical protein ACFE04_025505 [Oxalis oulophora]
MPQSPPNNHNPFTDLRSRLYPPTVAFNFQISLISTAHAYTQIGTYLGCLVNGRFDWKFSHLFGEWTVVQRVQEVIQSPTIRSSFGNNKDGMLPLLQFLQSHFHQGETLHFNPTRCGDPLPFDPSRWKVGQTLSILSSRITL